MEVEPLDFDTSVCHQLGAFRRCTLPLCTFLALRNGARPSDSQTEEVDGGVIRGRVRRPFARLVLQLAADPRGQLATPLSGCSLVVQEDSFNLHRVIWTDLRHKRNSGGDEAFGGETLDLGGRKSSRSEGRSLNGPLGARSSHVVQGARPMKRGASLKPTTLSFGAKRRHP